MFFGVFDFFQKTNENKLTWGIIVVKSNSSVRFLEESPAWKNHYDFVWPLQSAKENISKFTPDFTSFKLPSLFPSGLRQELALSTAFAAESPIV